MTGDKGVLRTVRKNEPHKGNAMSESRCIECGNLFDANHPKATRDGLFCDAKCLRRKAARDNYAGGQSIREQKDRKQRNMTAYGGSPIMEES